MSIEIKNVKGKSGLKEFVEVQYSHYKDNQYFIPPMMFDELNTFDADKNPVHKFCETMHYIAYDNNVPVGRIVGIINHRFNEKYSQKQARFGWVEFTDNEDVSKSLLAKVEEWAKEQGMNHVIGPMGYSDLDFEGCLVEGFDQIGTSSTIYNYPYYESHILNSGYERDVDWVEYKIFIPKSIPEKHIRIADIVKKKYNLTVITPTDRQLLVKEYGKKVFDLINISYAELYGFCKLTPEQIDYYINMYLKLLRLDCVRLIVDPDNNLISFGIAIPSMASAMQKAKGRLFPFGFAHLLKALKCKNDVIDLYLVAVHPDYQNKGVNALLFTELIPQFIKNGYKYAESNPELVLNEKVQVQWEYFERIQHKRRRAFRKKI